MREVKRNKVYSAVYEGAFDKDEKAIWTISKDENIPGWETDSGFDGYGLKKEDAEFYVKCINYCLENNIF